MYVLLHKLRININECKNKTKALCGIEFHVLTPGERMIDMWSKGERVAEQSQHMSDNYYVSKSRYNKKTKMGSQRLK